MVSARVHADCGDGAPQRAGWRTVKKGVKKTASPFGTSGARATSVGSVEKVKRRRSSRPSRRPRASSSPRSAPACNEGGHQWQSVAISVNQCQSVSISGNQWQSMAINGNQRRLVVVERVVYSQRRFRLVSASINGNQLQSVRTRSEDFVSS